MRVIIPDKYKFRYLMTTGNCDLDYGYVYFQNAFSHAVRIGYRGMRGETLILAVSSAQANTPTLLGRPLR